MFCHKCGANIEDGSTFCPYCGTQTGTPSDTAQQQQSSYQNDQQYGQNSQQYNQAPAQQNTLAIVGFILSFFASVPGLICSILGYKAAINNGAPHKNFAKAGIIISSIGLGLSVLLGIIYGSVFGAALSGALYGY